MATLPRKLCLAGCMLASVFLVGCNLMALPYFLMLGQEAKAEPKPGWKLASTDKEKEVKVLILASAPMETRPEFLRIDRDLTRLLYQSLTSGFKRNKEKVTVINPTQVEQYKDSHPQWRYSGPADIGKAFHADYVIDLEINQISLYEAGSSESLFHGQCDIAINLVDVAHPSDVHSDGFTRIYPTSRGAIDAMGSSPLLFRQKFLEVVANELSWKFTAHLIEDGYRME
jgi:hypothetical protein